jgi:ssDNA-specific exonuclease RecJ
MAIEGTVTNGMIVLDAPQVLPEGARVEVVLKPPAEQPKTLREILLESAGSMTDLPVDFAAQHDHYIHGTPKR